MEISEVKAATQFISDSALSGYTPNIGELEISEVVVATSFTVDLNFILGIEDTETAYLSSPIIM